MTADRLILPESLIPDAKVEIQRNDLHAGVVRLANDIYLQKNILKERRDTLGIVTLSSGETEPVPIMVGDDEFRMQLVLVHDYIRFPYARETWHSMSGISIRISKPESDEFAELGRIIKDNTLGITGGMDGGIVRKVGHETYKAIDTDSDVLLGLLQILNDYGEAIGYDPSKSRYSQQEVA